MVKSAKTKRYEKRAAIRAVKKIHEEPTTLLTGVDVISNLDLMRDLLSHGKSEDEIRRIFGERYEERYARRKGKAWVEARIATYERIALRDRKVARARKRFLEQAS